MLFKSWGYMTCSNGLVYISDMKVGHYMKIPPRSMFAAQLFAVVWLSIVQIATYNFLLGNIEGICTRDQLQGLTCPNARTFYNASVIWGVIVSFSPSFSSHRRMTEHTAWHPPPLPVLVD